MSTAEAYREVKKYSIDWVPFSKGDNEFKGMALKEQEVLSAAGMRGKNPTRLTRFNKE